ncbi:hypothetical protein Ddc_18389 [Ditylenchus destructor]|nr:hypothetical protein Ddc_18389 [Ditylenchus destructor]
MADPQNQLEMYRNQISDLRSALNEANAQINHLQEKLDKVSNQNPGAGNNQLISMNQKLRMELSAMKAKLETTEKQKHESMEQVGYLNRVLVEAIAAEAKLNEEIAQLKSNPEDINSKLRIAFNSVQLELQTVKDQRDEVMDRAAKYQLEWVNAAKKSKETEVLLAKTRRELDRRMHDLRSTNIGVMRLREKMKEQEAGNGTYKQGTCWNMLEPDVKKPLVKPMPDRVPERKPLKPLVEELQDKIKTLDRDLEKERKSRRRDQKTVTELQKEMEETRKTMNRLLQTSSTSSRKRQSNEKSPSKSASRESSVEPSKRPHLGKQSTSGTIDDYNFLKTEPIE